jgi:hypothetical protein
MTVRKLLCFVFGHKWGDMRDMSLQHYVFLSKMSDSPFFSICERCGEKYHISEE